MHLRSSLETSCRLGLALAGLTLVVGCGTATYEALMLKRLADVKLTGPFETLWGPTQLAGTPVTLRIPKIFVQSFLEDSPHPQDGNRIDAPVNPPFLPLPGLKLCFEAYARDQQGTEYPHYCYLAAVANNAGDPLDKTLLEKLKTEFPDTGEWTDVPCRTPQGTEIAWKKLRVTGEQFFDSNKSGGQAEFRKFPAIFELWMHVTEGFTVLIGWRIVDKMEPTIKLTDLAPLTAGTLALAPIAPAAPAAAPAK